jgi:hypothetical protein
MSSTVRISWSREFENEQQWNEVCAWAIEHFGLPGDRFQSHATIDYMDFVFKSNKDALVMAIMWNAPIVPNNDLAVEHIGKMINV